MRSKRKMLQAERDRVMREVKEYTRKIQHTRSESKRIDYQQVIDLLILELEQIHKEISEL